MYREEEAQRVRRWFDKLAAELGGSRLERLPKLTDLRAGGETGIQSVAGECADIRKKTSGEGEFQDYN